MGPSFGPFPALYETISSLSTLVLMASLPIATPYSLIPSSYPQHQ